MVPSSAHTLFWDFQVCMDASPNGTVFPALISRSASAHLSSDMRSGDSGKSLASGKPGPLKSLRAYCTSQSHSSAALNSLPSGSFSLTFCKGTPRAKKLQNPEEIPGIPYVCNLLGLIQHLQCSRALASPQLSLKFTMCSVVGCRRSADET